MRCACTFLLTIGDLKILELTTNWLCLFVISHCSAQVQKKKAQKAEIILPWEKGTNSDIPASGGAKQATIHPKDSGFKANYYNHPEPIMRRIANPAPTMEKLQQSEAVRVELLLSEAFDSFE